MVKVPNRLLKRPSIYELVLIAIGIIGPIGGKIIEGGIIGLVIGGIIGVFIVVIIGLVIINKNLKREIKKLRKKLTNAAFKLETEEKECHTEYSPGGILISKNEKKKIVRKR